MATTTTMAAYVVAHRYLFITCLHNNVIDVYVLYDIYGVAYVLMKLVTLLSLLPEVRMPTVSSSVCACFRHIFTAPLEVWHVFYSVFMRIECIHVDAHIF